jgi:hypothetical protein
VAPRHVVELLEERELAPLRRRASAEQATAPAAPTGRFDSPIAMNCQNSGS